MVGFPDSQPFPAKYQHFLCLRYDVMVCCETDRGDANKSRIHVARLDRVENALRWQRSVEVPQRVMAMTSYDESTRVVLETADGSVYIIDEGIYMYMYMYMVVHV